MKLVIVESPAKCSKIQGYLGDGYVVKATMGHIRALDESLDSVGIERDWDPKYVEISTKREAIAKLRSAARGAEVILATDDDREGEGIAWHVCFLLKLNPLTTQRIVFHEITRPAILAAVSAPRLLDMNKVNAQQARSMLDLLVGFTISKVLWNRVAPRLSAGRCQTPALRLVVERDAEVENHKSAASWKLCGTSAAAATATPLEIQAVSSLPSQEEATAILEKVHTDTRVLVGAVKESVSTNAAPKPFITSTLQQEASSLHGLGPKATMAAAQKLYEGGHITYMRTDNAMLSAEAAAAVRAYVTEKHGAEFVGMAGQHTMGTNAVEEAVVEEGAAGAAAPKKGKKVKKSAAAATAAATATAPAPQAAHEAIRPTHVDLSEVDVSDPAQKTIYKLIWRRAIQSQMAASQTDVRKASIALAAEPDRVWNAEQSKLRFAGWKVLDSKDPASMKVEAEVWEEWAPHLVEGATLHWTTLQADEVFSKPKGRFTEASLIAELEKRGIGRPSTFASLVSTIVDREYVEKTNVEGKAQDSHHLMLKPRKWPPTLTTQSHKVGAEKNKLRSTALGRSVSDFLGREYSDLFNYDFTATMEQDLDIISRGEKPWKSLLQTTWDLYKERYAAQTTGGSAVAKAARERILADGLKVILSRKGPLYVKDPPAGSPKSVKATFAPLLAGTTYESATAEEAEAAFTAATLAKEGDLVGKLGDDEIRKKKGPYGFYAECKGVRVPLNGSEPLERIREKLTAKISFSTSEDGGTPYERKVGDYTIKKGPYGLYMYKHTLKRVNFVKFPTGVDPEKVNAADCAAAYSVGLNRKKRGGGGAAAAAKKTTTDD